MSGETDLMGRLVDPAERYHSLLLRLSDLEDDLLDDTDCVKGLELLREAAAAVRHEFIKGTRTSRGIAEPFFIPEVCSGVHFRPIADITFDTQLTAWPPMVHLFDAYRDYGWPLAFRPQDRCDCGRHSLSGRTVSREELGDDVLAFAAGFAERRPFSPEFGCEPLSMSSSWVMRSWPTLGPAAI